MSDLEKQPNIGLWLAEEFQRLRQEDKAHAYIQPGIIGPMSKWMAENNINPAGRSIEEIIDEYTVSQYIDKLRREIESYLKFPKSLQADPRILEEMKVEIERIRKVNDKLSYTDEKRLKNLLYAAPHYPIGSHPGIMDALKAALPGEDRSIGRKITRKKVELPPEYSDFDVEVAEITSRDALHNSFKEEWLPLFYGDAITNEQRLRPGPPTWLWNESGGGVDIIYINGKPEAAVDIFGDIYMKGVRSGEPETISQQDPEILAVILETVNKTGYLFPDDVVLREYLMESPEDYGIDEERDENGDINEDALSDAVEETIETIRSTEKISYAVKRVAQAALEGNVLAQTTLENFAKETPEYLTNEWLKGYDPAIMGNARRLPNIMDELIKTFEPKIKDYPIEINYVSDDVAEAMFGEFAPNKETQENKEMWRWMQWVRQGSLKDAIANYKKALEKFPRLKRFDLFTEIMKKKLSLGGASIINEYDRIPEKLLQFISPDEIKEAFKAWLKYRTFIYVDEIPERLKNNPEIIKMLQDHFLDILTIGNPEIFQDLTKKNILTGFDLYGEIGRGSQIRFTDDAPYYLRNYPEMIDNTKKAIEQAINNKYRFMAHNGVDVQALNPEQKVALAEGWAQKMRNNFLAHMGDARRIEVVLESMPEELKSYPSIIEALREVFEIYAARATEIDTNNTPFWPTLMNYMSEEAQEDPIIRKHLTSIILQELDAEMQSLSLGDILAIFRSVVEKGLINSMIVNGALEAIDEIQLPEHMVENTLREEEFLKPLYGPYMAHKQRLKQIFPPEPEEAPVANEQQIDTTQTPDINTIAKTKGTWYKRIKPLMKICAALPNSGYPEDGNEKWWLSGDPYFGSALGKINDRLTEESVKRLETQYGQDLQYLGHGENGVAFENSNGTVVKVTSDPGEVENAKRLIDAPQKGFVKVYSVNVLQSDPPLWVLETEKVDDLTPEEKQIMTLLFPDTPTLVDNPESEFAEVESNRTRGVKNYRYYQMKLITFYKDAGPKEFALLKKLYKSYVNLARGLEMVSDVHIENLGWNNRGEMVILDLG